MVATGWEAGGSPGFQGCETNPYDAIMNDTCPNTCNYAYNIGIMHA